MKHSVRQKLDAKKRRRERRVRDQKSCMRSPMLRCPGAKLELAERTQAVSCGGLVPVQQLVRQVGLAESINRHCPIFRLHLPYTEGDHVLNMAFNLFAGGSRLEHLEFRRNDEAYLNLLGAERIPDPTTAGDFCRRFTPLAVDRLMDSINEARVKVWQQRPETFFDRAIVEADGTMVETTGEKKEGIGMNPRKQWGYEVLAESVAEAGRKRKGSRTSHGTEEDFAANGLRHLPPAARAGAGSDPKTRTPPDLPPALLDTVDGNDLPAARIRPPAAASLTRDQERSVTCPTSAPIRRHHPHLKPTPMPQRQPESTRGPAVSLTPRSNLHEPLPRRTLV